MGRPRLVPDKDELRKLSDAGLSDEEIAVLVYERTGQRINRNTISVARSRYGLKPQRPRYVELIPWRIDAEFATSYELRMLRAEARLRADGTLPDSEMRRLTRWKAMLKLNDAVVHYEPGLGFFYMAPRPGIDTDLIRQPEAA